MPEKLPPISRPNLSLVYDGDSIAAVEPILEPERLISRRDQLDELVEGPALPACQYLYDLNIQTLSSCANGEKVSVLGSAYIDIDWYSLSETNKEIAQKVGAVIDDNRGTEGVSDKRVKLSIPLSPNDKSEAVTSGLLAIARLFEPQSLNWGFEPKTIEQIREDRGVREHEIADGILIAELDKQGYAYDAQSQRLFFSDELRQKYRDAETYRGRY